MADFELVTVKTANQLHENLVKLLKNKKHIESLVVSKTTEDIRVDLSGMANGFGNPDFRLKLKSGKAAEAERIINRLKSQDAPTGHQSEELFEMLDPNGSRS